MIKRADIVSKLKTMSYEQLPNDGPTSVFFDLGRDKGAQSFNITIQNEIITVTAGKLLFKRKYRIHKNELQAEQPEK